jgi:hypothetical protein
VLRRMSPQPGRLTSSRNLSSRLQLVTLQVAKLNFVLLPLPYSRQHQRSLRCYARYSMQAQAAVAHPEEYQLLVSSSDDGRLAALRSLLSQVWLHLQSHCIQQNSNRCGEAMG